MLAAVIMNGIPELRLSQHSKIKTRLPAWQEACRYGNEWCVAITLDSKDFPAMPAGLFLFLSKKR
jgi:hypothetical protein